MRSRAALLVVLIGLVAGLGAPAIGAAKIPPPTGAIRCGTVAGFLKWGPALKTTAASHRMKLQGVADDCDVSFVTGGAAPIASVVFSGSTTLASVSCADLQSASPITVALTVSYWSGPHGTGTKVSSSKVPATALALTPFNLTGVIGTGAFANTNASLVTRLNTAVDDSATAVQELCSAPFGLSQTTFVGVAQPGEIGGTLEVAPPSTLATLGVVGTASTIAPPPLSAVPHADYHYGSNGLAPPSSTYTVTGYDQYGNALGDVTSESTLTGATCVANVCTGSAPGHYVITATDGSATGTTTLDVADYSTTTISCQGQNYDVNDVMTDGCETAGGTAGTTQTAANYIGDLPCNDGSSAFSRSNSIASDRRAHQNPGVTGFDATTGSAPAWYYINAVGGFLCSNDYSVSFTTSGGGATPCYQVSVITDKGTQSATISGNGSTTLTSGSGSYSATTVIYLEVQKTCALPVIDNVMFTVAGHL